MGSRYVPGSRIGVAYHDKFRELYALVNRLSSELRLGQAACDELTNLIVQVQCEVNNSIQKQQEIINDLSPEDKSEPRFPNIHPAFLACNRLIKQKSHDYGETDNARLKYHPYGALSYMHMIHLKLARLENLNELTETGQEPRYESAKDSVMDLINYAAFYWSYLDNLEEERYDTHE